MAEASGSRQVVIIGGGFAGLFAARMLARAPVQVTLLDRAEHHLFQPLLYQCATGIMSEGKIAYPLRELLWKHGNVEFVIAEVTGLDAAGAGPGPRRSATAPRRTAEIRASRAVRAAAASDHAFSRCFPAATDMPPYRSPAGCGGRAGGPSRISVAWSISSVS